MPGDFLAILDQDCKATSVALSDGETLFRQGDAVRWLYRVTAGSVRLCRVLARGAEIALARTGGGDILAEASLFASRYHCDAIAEEPSVLRRYATREVRALMDRSPETATAYSAYLARQLMDLRATVEIRAIRRADERLLAWLRLRAQGTPPVFEPQGVWLSVARQIGLTGESLYRALARLERTGRIMRQGGRVTFTNKHP